MWITCVVCGILSPPATPPAGVGLTGGMTGEAFAVYKQVVHYRPGRESNCNI